jgi:hypothetical protein
MARTVEQRFETKIKKTNSCWEWSGARNAKGYGMFNSGVGITRVQLAHRYAYATYKGELLPYMYVLHSCDNPSCVNPAHLFLGTQQDNMQDCLSKGRRPGKLTTQQKQEIIHDPRIHREIAKDYGISYQLVSRMKRQFKENVCK